MDDLCPICIEPLSHQNTWAFKSCGHKIHSTCFSRFIEHKVQENKEIVECPICRDILFSDTIVVVPEDNTESPWICHDMMMTVSCMITFIWLCTFFYFASKIYI